MLFLLLKEGCRVQAGLLFEAEEWQAAYILAEKPVLRTAPTLNEVLHTVVERGGFLARKSDGEPGVKTMWLGLQRSWTSLPGFDTRETLVPVKLCVTRCITSTSDHIAHWARNHRRHSLSEWSDMLHSPH